MKHTHRGSGERGQPEPSPKEMDDRTKRELSTKVEAFDLSAEAGIVPTLSEYRTICAARAKLVRENIKTIDPTWAPSLTKEAEALERAAEGSSKDLIADALRHANGQDTHISTYRGLKNLALEKGKLENVENYEREIEKSVLAKRTWEKLAELAKEQSE